MDIFNNFLHIGINPLSARCLDIWAINLVITVPAAVLAPNSAGSSAVTMMTMKLYMFASKFHWLSFIQFIGPYDTIENGPQHVTSSHNTSSVNSLWPSDTIWHHITWSTLVQVMSCCLMATSHYQNQCCGIQIWAMLNTSIPDMSLKITNLRLWQHLPGANEWNNYLPGIAGTLAIFT